MEIGKLIFLFNWVILGFHDPCSFSGVVVDVTDCTSVETLKLLDA